MFFEKANNVLGFSITEIMFNGSTIEELKKQKVTQPAIFIHSVINYLISNPPIPTMAAGHFTWRIFGVDLNWSISIYID